MSKRPAGRGSAKLSVGAVSIRKRLTGVKILDWHELGTPHPDVISGTVQTGLSNVAKNVMTLSKLKELRDLNILINGIPRPDIAHIKFTLRG